jgi:hypothetical protein
MKIRPPPIGGRSISVFGGVNISQVREEDHLLSNGQAGRLRSSIGE